MNHWEIQSDEASIVVLGNFNPKIFHPEWFIRKEVVEEWPYADDENLVVLPDMAQLNLPDQRNLLVLLNKFQVKSSRASNYSALKDFISSTFAILAETPVKSMGMNYNSIIKIPDPEHWEQFGRMLAPQDSWTNATGFLKDLDSDKRKELGLWDMTMNIPRNDTLTGFIRARVNVEGLTSARTIRFSMNSHVELDDSGAKEIPVVLEKSWDDSLAFAKSYTERMLDTHLGKET